MAFDTYHFLKAVDWKQNKTLCILKYKIRLFLYNILPPSKKFFWPSSSLQTKRRNGKKKTLDILYIPGQSQFPAVFSLSIPPVLFLMTYTDSRCCEYTWAMWGAEGKKMWQVKFVFLTKLDVSANRKKFNKLSILR